MLDINMESLLDVQDNALIFAGNLNKLNCKLLETKHGLSQLVVRATRQQNILDVFCTTTPDLFTVKVMCFCVRSDHKAVLINCNDVNGDNNKSNFANDCIRVTVFDLNPNTLKTFV